MWDPGGANPGPTAKGGSDGYPPQTRSGQPLCGADILNYVSLCQSIYRLTLIAIGGF